MKNETTGAAQRFSAPFSAFLLRLGYSEAFCAALLKKHAQLFSMLSERAGAEDLFSKPEPPGFWRKTLPEAFGPDPEENAGRLAVLAFLYAALRPFGIPGKNPATARERQEKPAEAVIRLPDAARFNAVIEAVRQDPAFLAAEKERRALFGKDEDETEALMLERLRFLERQFGLRLQNRELLAKKILALRLSQTVREGRIAAVTALEAVKPQKRAKQSCPFAVAYCACMNPLRYPILNGRVRTALTALRDTAGFYSFRNDDLADYNRYLAVLNLFAKAAGLQGKAPMDLALYLEAEGKRLETGG